MKRNTCVHCIEMLLVGTLLAFGLAACEQDGNIVEEETTGKYPAIEIAPGELCSTEGEEIVGCAYEFDLSAAEAGDVIGMTLRIRNSGERDLLVKEISLTDYQAAVGAEETAPAFSLEVPPAFTEAQAAGEKFTIAILGEGTQGNPEELAVRVNFTRSADEFQRTATLVIRTDAANSPLVKVSLSTAMGHPAIQVNPTWLDFQVVAAGQVAQQQLNIFNTGAADLLVSGFSVSGSSAYTVSVHGAEYPVDDSSAAGITFDEGIVIPPGDKTYFQVRFAPETADSANAVLYLFSNDPDEVGGTEVKITGNQAVPCLAVNPETVNFGGKSPGETAVVPLELTTCGDTPVAVTGLHLAAGSSPDFGLDLESLGQEVSEDSPLIVPLGGSVMVNVTFTPDVENPVVEGETVLDEGTLVIVNNSFESELLVPLRGAGGIPGCPTALIKCEEGDEVIPQTVLHLFGDESYAPNGQITKWEWSVDQPVGSQEVFVPSSSFPNPTFTANTAGVYTFQLTVYDSMNVPSCYPETYEVVVIPDEAIHIELLWQTPNDLDETDTGPESGSDLDLHFKHPWAAGPDLDGDGAPDGWFDIPFDCFWFNAHPNWGSFDSAINDDPGLDRDDTDGAGPENINLDIPENLEYCVGVHYWDDHGYGSAYATVRVYIYAQLVFEVSDMLLLHHDMWEVACIKWPSGAVQVVTDGSGGPKITPDYDNPYFFSNP